jgi:hypothetical protein
MTITKFFRDGNTGETRVAFSSWGMKFSISTDLLLDYPSGIYAPPNQGYYYSNFYVYELSK